MTTTTTTTTPTDDERNVLIEDRMAAAYRIPEAADKRLEEALAQSNELESGCFIGDSTEWIWGDAMYPETLTTDEWTKISAMWDDEGHAGYYVYLGELEPDDTPTTTTTTRKGGKAPSVSLRDVYRAADELNDLFSGRCVSVHVEMGDVVRAVVNCASIGEMTPDRARAYAKDLADAIKAAETFEFNGFEVDFADASATK